MIRLLVSGTRHKSAAIETRVWKELDEYKAEYGELFLILGDANGVDSYAKDWAEARRQDHVICYAKWKTLGKSAGNVRNGVMFTHNPNMVLTFPAPDSKGTLNAIRMAEQRNLKPRVVSVSIP